MHVWSHSRAFGRSWSVEITDGFQFALQRNGRVQFTSVYHSYPFGPGEGAGPAPPARDSSDCGAPTANDHPHLRQRPSDVIGLHSCHASHHQHDPARRHPGPAHVPHPCSTHIHPYPGPEEASCSAGQLVQVQGCSSLHWWVASVMEGWADALPLSSVSPCHSSYFLTSLLLLLLLTSDTPRSSTLLSLLFLFLPLSLMSL